MNHDLFKSSISCFATGVAVVTTEFKKQRSGITINSLCSVSLKPPMILYCLDKSAECFDPFFYAKEFFVNILNAKQQYASVAFAKNDRKEWKDLIERNLKILQSSCVLKCRTYHKYEGGDHKIIVALVEDCANVSNDCGPLIYYKSQYHSITKCKTK